MLVREIMHSPVITANPDTSLSAAYALIQQHDIRHLPVVEEGRLVGIVSDRDLRLATSALNPKPFSSAARVAQVMIPDPITATPWDPVEEAARIMRSQKIGSLPILEGTDLVGIITGPDLLDALIRLTGLSKPTGRLAVHLTDAPGQFTELTALIDKGGITIHSVLSYPDKEDHPYVILRVNTLNTRALADELRASGFDVAWPPPKTWSD